jgi:pyridoxal/pyridoxine/pyridoxamine kinase
MITGMKVGEGWAVALDGALLPFGRIPVSIPGTGDLFDAIVTALVLRGNDLPVAAEKAATLAYLAVGRTIRERKYGLDVTSIRKELAAI